LELSVLRYYVVYALKRGRPDKVKAFFELAAEKLLHQSSEWNEWFALPYIRTPARDQRFAVFFCAEWLDMLHASVCNCLEEVFANVPLPAVLRFNEDRLQRKALEAENARLRIECERLQDVVKGQNATLKTRTATPVKACPGTLESSTSGDGNGDQSSHIGQLTSKMSTAQATGNPPAAMSKRTLTAPSAELTCESSPQTLTRVSTPEIPPVHDSARNHEVADDRHAGPVSEKADVMRVRSQEAFSGHTGPITRCLFSADGMDVASSSEDGTVRIWTPGDHLSTARNATIYCGTPVISLDWDARSDKLLVLGTVQGDFKIWNADSKRVVGDVNVGVDYPRVVDLKCSPSEAVMVTATCTAKSSSKQEGCLSVWSLKTVRKMHTLALGAEPPAVNAITFNHNGKIIAAASDDGMVRLFDMAGRTPIMGWASHAKAAACSICFGPDQNSIFSLGSDGKLVEWSLHSLRTKLWSADVSRIWGRGGGAVSSSQASARMVLPQLALDLQGRNLLTTSPNSSTPLVRLGSNKSNVVSVLEGHSGAVTAVDWHPNLSMCLTGSADNSVRVTAFDS
jgi:WD40 repeat protein